MSQSAGGSAGMAASASEPALSSTRRSQRPEVPPLSLNRSAAADADGRRPATGSSWRNRPPTAISNASSSLPSRASQELSRGSLASRRSRSSHGTGRSNRSSHSLANFGAALGMSTAKPNAAVLAAQKRAKEQARKLRGDAMSRSDGASTHSWLSTGRTGASEKHRERLGEEVPLPWMTPKGTKTRSQIFAARRKAAGIPTGQLATRAAGSGLFFKNISADVVSNQQRAGKRVGDPGSDTPKYPPIGLRYVEHPKFRTRTELLEHRRQRNLPPLAYDFDGDGVVDNFELFLGTRIDTNKDGRIDTAERKAAKGLLDELKDMYTFGLDAAGANVNTVTDLDDGGTVKQKPEEAVQPPWAVSSRRGYHDSARSRWSDIGAAYKIAALEKRAVQVAAKGPDGKRTENPYGIPVETGRSQASRPSTGMSALIGV